jgi:hypothetical protein
MDKFDLIRQWAKERGIYDKGDVKTQLIKLYEETDMKKQENYRKLFSRVIKRSLLTLLAMPLWYLPILPLWVVSILSIALSMLMAKSWLELEIWLTEHL